MANRNYPLYEVPKINSLRELVEMQARNIPDKEVFKFRRGEEICVVTYGELCRQTQYLGTNLLARGYGGKKIAILGENSYAWILGFFAVTGAGIVAVPLDKELSAAELSVLVKDSGCAALIYSDTYADVAQELKGRLADIPMDDLSMEAYDSMIQMGRDAVSAGDTSYMQQKPDVDKTAAIIYTSGTTGESKGVMLSHRNFARDTYSACSNVDIKGDTLSLLPFHHTFGLVAGIFANMLYGRMIFINTSLRYLAEDLQEVRPVILFLVPLFVETFYKNIRQKTGAFTSAPAYFGGKLESIISGGAPLNPKYLQEFRAVGINLLNGYGITECSPVVAVNRNEYYRDGSVGQVVNECRVDIRRCDGQGEGEIWVKGSIVMQGYYHREEETKAVLQDGWFDTGDLGHLDEDGFLFITGRKKNLIILGNGENVSPEELEEMICSIPLVAECIVDGRNGKIHACIYPDMEQACVGGLHGTDDIKKFLEKEIEECNRRLPSFKQIREISIRETEFEKTTTKKIKRKV